MKNLTEINYRNIASREVNCKTWWYVKALGNELGIKCSKNMLYHVPLANLMFMTMDCDIFLNNKWCKQNRKVWWIDREGIAILVKHCSKPLRVYYGNSKHMAAKIESLKEEVAALKEKIKELENA